MKRQQITSFFLKAAAILILAASFFNADAQTKSPLHKNIGLIYPVSTNGRSAPKDTNNFSLNLLAGVSAAERGVTIAGVSNIIHQNAQGFQIAGLTNHVGKNADGTLVAGLLNMYSGGNGFAIAGLANISPKSTGTQVSGILNKGGSTSSLQVSGFANIAGNVKGLQAAGFLNLAKKVKGLQLGFINIADSANTQIGIVNISKNGEQAFALSPAEL
jgi:hypothetical protein